MTRIGMANTIGDTLSLNKELGCRGLSSLSSLSSHSRDLVEKKKELKSLMFTEGAQIYRRTHRHTQVSLACQTLVCETNTKYSLDARS